MDLTTLDVSQIRENYKKRLKISPQRGDVRQIFLCPVGLVGAGKSTVVKPLSEKLSLVRISSDEIREMLKERNVGYDQLAKILMPLAEEFALQGRSIAFDADCGNPKTKEMILGVAEKVKAKVFWIHINPPEEFILRKLRNYNHTWLFKNGEEAVENYFEQKKKRQEESTHFDFCAVIDTSKSDLPNQIQNAFDLIERESSKENNV